MEEADWVAEILKIDKDARAMKNLAAQVGLAIGLRDTYIASLATERNMLLREVLKLGKDAKERTI